MYYVLKRKKLKNHLSVYAIINKSVLKINFYLLCFLQQDIRNQRRYRQRRKAELVKLQQTHSALNSKAVFYEEQVDYYKSYTKTCMDNLAKKGK